MCLYSVWLLLGYENARSRTKSNWMPKYVFILYSRLGCELSFTGMGGIFRGKGAK